MNTNTDGAGADKGKREHQSERTGGQGSTHSSDHADEQVRQQMKRLLETYRTQRRQLGVEEADGAWMRQPLRAWMDGLGGSSSGQAVLDMEAVQAIGIAMRETLSIRDALIVSMVCQQSQAKYDTIYSLCAQPHQDSSLRLTCQALDAAFTDPNAQPDRARCRAGIEMLEHMVACLPKDYHAQPLAVMSYVYWWLGQPQSRDYAQEALRYDAHCTLASIMLVASRRPVRPAWMQGGEEPTTFSGNRE
ncbi:DUF4192 domain-containing protein [Bombiscardovia nodaiensis]|uniref:DUF4192 domain-containing protein n=1 Tax=Bombiscardovia nodaiensis TaxID=2932181 RepID=A0ABM8B9B2_9BIFI|nr:DUF4192 domain-containing protein [Bombiscardovia nodaiensis]